MMANQTPTLFIVATPIGNRDDISLRALETLKHVDIILAEDTRHSQRLLTHWGVDRPLISLHAHNEATRTKKVMAALGTGKNLALISDAGTPLVSDPGAMLVKQVRAAGFCVVPIPGACAAITALCAAGVDSSRFYFAGFLSARPAQRQQQLKALQETTTTLIFYEAPHRIIATLEDIATLFPAREVVLAKELTKRHEAFVAGLATEVLTWLREDDRRQQGEFVVLLSGKTATPAKPQLTLSTETLLTELLVVLPLKTAVNVATTLTGLSKNALYDTALALAEKRKL